MEIVVKGITREPLCFECELMKPRGSRRLYRGGPVRNCLMMEITKGKEHKIKKKSWRKVTDEERCRSALENSADDGRQGPCELKYNLTTQIKEDRSDEVLKEGLVVSSGGPEGGIAGFVYACEWTGWDKDELS